MASKLRLITDLYGETLTEISNNPDEWMSFLECAAMNYKYPFNDQVLIYAQRPQAVACAKIEAWNKQVGRWVNRGAKGIALLSEDNGYTNLRYVFDIADTNSKYGKSFRLWSVPKPYELDIIESLENKYGELEDKSSLGIAIKSVAKIIVEDNISDYLDDLMFYRESSSLENLSEENVKTLFQNALENSIAFSIIKRCGLEPKQYFSQEDFSTILNFDSYDTITRLGVATSEISEMGLREIYQTIKKLRLNEINKIRTFEVENDLSYDVSVNGNNAERRNENEHNLYTPRGLRDTRLDDTREQDSSGGQIRNDEIKILEREQEKPLYNSTNEESTSTTFDGDTRNSTRESGTNSIRDESQGEYNRELETTRPNEVGTTNEQLEDVSRGDSSERIDLRLDVYNKTNNVSYVVVDEKINQILSTTPHLRKSNKEIKEFFNNEQDITKRVKYLREIFNSDYTGVIVDDQMYWYKTYDNGILFCKGKSFINREAESLVSWEDLTYHYEAMILLNQLNDKIEPLPSLTDQLSFIEDNSEKTVSDLEFTQEFIDRYLTEQSSESKYRIYEVFQKSYSTDDNINFIKNQYGMGGSSYTIKGSGIGVSYDYKGIRFNRGYFDPSSKEQLFKWNYIEKRIKTLIKEDRYLNPKEKEDYPKWLEDTEKEREFIEASERLAEVENEGNVEETFEYQYHLGDKVYIGADEYEILNLGDTNVLLYDYQYPLFNREMSREEFDRKVKENPCNDHLKVKIDVKAEQEDKFSAVEFEKQFPHNMRFKESSVIENNLYWITQELFTENDLKLFQEAFKKTNFEKAYVTVRDLSNYVFEEDLEKKVFAIVTKDSINYTDYVASIKEVFGSEASDYFTKKEEITQPNAYGEFNDKVDLVDNNDSKKVEEDLIGKNITIDDREFTIDSIANDIVSLRDITFQNDVGFPIFRDENLETVLSLLAEKEKNKETITSNIGKKRSSKITNFDIHPDIPISDRNQFRILNDNLGEGTLREKFNRNVEVIKVLKKCEEENRFATQEEQEILSQYVGWGGLPQVFDEMDSSWSNEYYTLKNLLDEKEYSQARESTLTAFYTPPVVIRTMYKALENMGLKTGNILEPSCGTGNFIGMLPDSLKDCKIYGVELDSISGRIARQLYQKSSVAVQGYEDTNLPNSFFDVAVGNVPFGDFKVIDKKYDKNKFLIHDYFFAKTLDKIRPGGVVAFITSKGTLDKENPSVRRYIAQRADLLGAIRLPNNTFKANAGTEVTSDIIFLQKRDSITDIEPDWVYLGEDENGIKMNQYFIDNPDMIMGNMEMISTRFGYDSACISDGTNLENKLEKNMN